MKKLILFLLFVPVLSFGQTIKGIGKLSIDMSFKEVQTLFPKKMVKQQTSSPIKKVYKLSSYTPIREHTFNNIYLYFYNDTLYAIYSLDAPVALKESFTIKYGKPTEKFYRFRSSVEEMAAIFDLDAVDFIYKWDNTKTYGFEDTFYKWQNDNPFIQVLYVFGTYYDGEDIKAKEIFYIKDIAIAKCVELEEEKAKLEDREKKAKELEGL